MRISDWSSDVCASDLACEDVVDVAGAGVDLGAARGHRVDQRVVVVEAGAVVGADAPGDLAQLQAHDLAHVVVAQRIERDHRGPAEEGRLERALQLRPQQFGRSEEHTSELQSLMRTSYAVFCLKKQN